MSSRTRRAEKKHSPSKHSTNLHVNSKSPSVSTEPSRSEILHQSTAATAVTPLVNGAATDQIQPDDWTVGTLQRLAERWHGRDNSRPLAILVMLAVIYSLYFAKAVFLPLMTAVVLALFFRPLIRWGRRHKLPAELSAGMVLLGLIACLATGAAYLVAPAQDWIDNAPHHFRVAGDRLHGVLKHVEQINEATSKVEMLAAGKSLPAAPLKEKSPGTSPAAEAVDHPPIDPPATAEKQVKLQTTKLQAVNEPVPVEMRQPRLVTGMAFISSTGSFLGELFITLVLAYFLLASGDMLINNVLKVLPSMREKRNVVELVYSVEKGISSYMMTVTCINVGLGIAIGLAMWLLGMPNPALWGAMAAILNFLPYLGALIGICVVFLVALLSFDSLTYACLIPATYFGITFVEGNFITPHLIGRSLRLNPIMVFLSLTFGGWLWGMGGAILAVPIVAMLKVGFDQFERTRPIGTLLGGSETS